MTPAPVKMSPQAAAEAMAGAIKTNNLDALHTLLFTDRADPNLMRNGLPMLHIAAQLERDQAITMLLQAGANVHKPDTQGRSALRMAISVGHAVSVRKLIEAGADPTAFVYERETGMDVSDASLSRRHGADVASAVFRVVDRFEVNQWAREKNLVRLLDLLKDEIPPDTFDRFGETALMEAIGEGFADGVAALLKHKADPNLAAKDGRTAMHFAAGAKYPALLQMVYDAGGRMSARDTQGMTPLQYAEKSGDAAMIAAARRLAREEDRIFVTSATQLSKPVVAPKTAKFRPRPAV